MPENVAPRSGAPAAGPGNRGKGAYQDRDKPAQIRFSNISAAKGIALPAAVRVRGAFRSLRVVPPWGAPLCAERARPPANVEAFGHAPSWVWVPHSFLPRACAVCVTWVRTAAA